MAVIKIAKDGGDIRTALLKEFQFNSIYDSFVIIQEDSHTIITDGSGNGSYTYTHNLNYTPHFTVFEKNPSTSGWTPVSAVAAAKVYATTTTIVITIDSGDPSTEYEYYTLIYGNAADGTVGTNLNNVSGHLRIAKDGYDAEKNTDARTMQFFSGKYVLKQDIVLSGTTDVISVPAFDVSEVTINHNLGYVPVIFIIDTGYSGLWNANMIPAFYQGIGGVEYEIYTNTFKIFIDNTSYPDPLDYVFKYQILRDKIE